MGTLFHKQKAPEVETNAPAVENPVAEPESPSLGAEQNAERKKNKGKKALKIDYVGSASGVNPIQ